MRSCTKGRGGKVVMGILLLLAGTVIWATRPVAIEGAWQGYVTKCLCDSANFLWFENGKITQYSDTHQTRDNMGEYHLLEDGSYRVVFYPVVRGDGMEDSPGAEWETMPRRWWMRHRLMDDIGAPMLPLHLYVFPVAFGVDADEIVRSAKARDRELDDPE